MSNLTRALMMGAAGAASDPLYVDDVFSTFLYDGDGTSSRSINNGIDLAGEGGLVWFKVRDDGDGHMLVDTVRGAGKAIESYDVSAEATDTNGLTAFTNTGFTVGNGNRYNQNTKDLVSWTFRKARGFFDVVTYTGNGTAGRTVAHSLGSVPGCIMVKNLSAGEYWEVYHRGIDSTAPENYRINLNRTAARSDSSTQWNDTAPTSTEFTLGTNDGVNKNNDSYVAYIFAHDDQSFGTDKDESIIKCGSYTGTSGDVVSAINLGWEPQWILIKKVTDDGDDKGWVLVDNMRRWTADGRALWIYANSSAAEQSADTLVKINSTGFQPYNSDLTVSNGDTHVYIAIRRPHKPTETAAECFDVFTQTGSSSIQLRPGTAGSSVTDMAIIKLPVQNLDWVLGTRLLGQNSLCTNNTSAQSTSKFSTSPNVWDQMSGTELATGVAGTNANGDVYINYHFARKPGFFDVVAYEGHQYRDASTNISSVPHNLGVVPEMIWIKSRTLSSSGSKWVVYHKDLGTSTFGVLNLDETVGTNYFLGNTPTSSIFKLFAGGFSTVDTSGNTYISYLFATLPGISKVGSFTGDGTSNRTIDCGFTTGARFVMIKRTDASANWFVFDSARGIVSGNDPYLTFNNDSAQVTNTDYIDPNNVGFEINTNNSDFNGSGGTYIFYAIA